MLLAWPTWCGNWKLSSDMSSCSDRDRAMTQLSSPHHRPSRDFISLAWHALCNDISGARDAGWIVDLLHTPRKSSIGSVDNYTSTPPIDADGFVYQLEMPGWTSRDRLSTLSACINPVQCRFDPFAYISGRKVGRRAAGMNQTVRRYAARRRIYRDSTITDDVRWTKNEQRKREIAMNVTAL